MNKHSAIACGTALILVLAGRTIQAQASFAPSQPPATMGSTAQSDSASVVSVIERFHATLTSGDSLGAMALLAPDAVILESGGVETRAEYQSHHLQGDISYAKSMKSTRGPIRVSVRGDVAWASSTSTTTGESRGRQVNSVGAELMVLTRTAEGWRISAIHWSSRAQRPPASPP
jgi:ketosteroid isomerase-like protein